MYELKFRSFPPNILPPCQMQECKHFGNALHLRKYQVFILKANLIDKSKQVAYGSVRAIISYSARKYFLISSKVGQTECLNFTQAQYSMRKCSCWLLDRVNKIRNYWEKRIYCSLKVQMFLRAENYTFMRKAKCLPMESWVSQIS